MPTQEHIHKERIQLRQWDDKIQIYQKNKMYEFSMKVLNSVNQLFYQQRISRSMFLLSDDYTRCTERQCTRNRSHIRRTAEKFHNVNECNDEEELATKLTFKVVIIKLKTLVKQCGPDYLRYFTQKTAIYQVKVNQVIYLKTLNLAVKLS